MALSFTLIQLSLLCLQFADGEMEVQSSLPQFTEQITGRTFGALRELNRFPFPVWILNQLRHKTNKMAEAEMEHKILPLLQIKLGWKTNG